MSLRILFVIFLITLTTYTQGQTASKPKPTLEEALVQARISLVLQDGKLSGPGADILNAAVQQSRFVMLGESHMTREIPRFTAAFCDMMHPDAYAVEAGPSAAHFVNGLLNKPNRLEMMSERGRMYPNNMAFLDVREENDLAVHCAASSHNPHFAVWGLDQEFLGSATTLLASMAASNPGPHSRAAITAAQVKDRSAEAEARRTGDFGKLFLLSATDADVQQLKTAIAEDGTPQTRDLFHEFSVSHRIYHLNGEGSPDSNLERAELLKQHFLADYIPFKRETPAPRIFFKLGDNHTGKGFNYTHELNLGNFIAEFAVAEQAKSLHIFVLGARGKSYTVNGYGKPLGQEPFVTTDDADYKWLAPAVADLLPQAAGMDGTTLTLFDLRQLRYRGLALSREWEHVIYSYDICILMPELTVGSLIE